jgi:heme/copper-type cytochrome/quinol oxidase subunit 3
VGGPLYGATFYTMTGFHGAHVSIGVLCLIFVLFRATKGAYTQSDHRGVELIGLYWHFVDLVWIILFTIVYLI